MDEPAFQLREFEKDGRRIQGVKVVRGDRLVEHFEDIGLNALYANPRPCHILGGQIDERTGKYEIWHTVGELRDMAEKNRNMADDDMPDVVTQNWLQNYHDEQDRRRLEASRKGVNGPYFRRMR